MGGEAGGSRLGRGLRLDVLRGGEARGIRCVGVKGVDIRRNTSGEGGLLDSN